MQGAYLSACTDADMLTLNMSVCTLLQNCPELATTGCEPSHFSINVCSRCFPEHFISSQKTNIKFTALCFTFVTVYLPVSFLLLFLHVPDIIIAVQGMIICLLWKLADCLSPVPEELPLEGVSLEKHHKSGFSGAQTHKGADRRAQGGEEDTAREGGRGTKWRCLHVKISILTGPSTTLPSLFLLLNGLVSRVWPKAKGGIEVFLVTNAFQKQYIYIYTDINQSNMLQRYKLLLKITLNERTRNKSLKSTLLLHK